MKKLITALLAIAVMSCNAINKITNNAKSKTNSIINTNTVTKKKADSTGAGSTKSTEAKILDSGYLKKTVVKEYYSDEFDFTSDLPNQVHVDNKLKAPISPSDNYPPSNTNKIKYREIIVTERGQLNKSEVRNQSTEQTAHIETRTNEKKGEFQATKTISNTKQTKKSATRVLSGVAVFLLIVFLFLFIYSRLEKVNLWQVLKSLIKL